MKIMKYSIPIVIFLCFSYHNILSAQEAETINYSVFTSDIKLTDNSKLEGISLNLNHEILNASLDTVNQYLTIQSAFDQKQLILCIYDLTNKKLLWSLLVHKKKYQIISLENYIILTSENKTICYNKHNGIEIWDSKRELLYVNEKNEVAFTYFSHFDKSNPNKLLEAIRLSDGKKIWTRNIDRYFGWNEILNINDSTIILSASGLHTINLKNGSGWDYDALTGEESISSSIPYSFNVFATVLTSLFSFAGAGVAYTIYYFSHTSELYWDLCSNVLIQGNVIYFASKQSLSALDFSGKIIWQKKLEKSMTTNSELMIEDSLLLLVNKGYAAMGKKKIYYGTPYLAGFNKNNGTNYYLKQINLEENAITDIHITDKLFILLQKDKIGVYSTLNGDFINREKIPEFKYQQNCAFINGTNFIIKDYASSSISMKADSLLYIYFQENGIICINQNLIEKDRFDFQQLLFKSHVSADLTFFENSDELIVFDSNFIQKGRIKLKNKAAYNGDKLMFFEKNTLNILDFRSL